MGGQEWAPLPASVSVPTPLPFSSVTEESQGALGTNEFCFPVVRKGPPRVGYLLTWTAFRRQNWESGEEVKAPISEGKCREVPACLPHPHLPSTDQSDSQETSTEQEVWSG